jgi:hypothetical protein
MYRCESPKYDPHCGVYETLGAFLAMVADCFGEIERCGLQDELVVCSDGSYRTIDGALILTKISPDDF